MEIERKFLIQMPEEAWLQGPEFRHFRITQTYLLAPQGKELRVRQRESGGCREYFKTEKRTLDDFTREEREQPLTEAEYLALLTQADPGRRQLCKDRFCLKLDRHTLEIDVYPFWDRTAIAEIELSSPEEPVCLPPEIRIIREVTKDPRFKNAALAACQDPGCLVMEDR